jgi:hypothetical protein
MSMKIDRRQVKVRDIADEYADLSETEEGVTGYGGRLDIRPKYQRNFVYDDKKRAAVIDTILKGYPLNVLYWVVKDDGTYEVMDGQQRIISACQYVHGEFSVDVDGSPKFFGGLSREQRAQVSNYQFTIFFCSEGTHDEKLRWFEIVNLAGMVLTAQELRNTVYPGPWLTSAKMWFSSSKCVASLMAGKYTTGSPNRQELLATAISWISDGHIKQYMSEHQNDQDSEELRSYFQSVISWVELTFTAYRKEMKGLNWGDFHRQFKDGTHDSAKLEAEIRELMTDDDVTSKKGIYSYVLTRDEKHLSIRLFTTSQKRAAYEMQKGACPACGDHFEIEEMEGDHITPWSLGGKTSADNCQMLCKDDNRRKGAS